MKSLLLLPLLVFSNFQWNGHNIPTTTIEGEKYILLRKLANILNGEYIWMEERKKAIVIINSTRYIFTAENRTIIRNEDGIHIPKPIKWDGEELYFPLSCFSLIFFKERATEIPNIEGIKVSGSNPIEIEIKITSPTEFELTSPSYRHHKLWVNARCLIKQATPKGGIKSIDISSSGNSTVLNFSLKNNYRAEVKKKKDGLLLLFYPTHKKKVFTIIIDPGHGGKDPGAIGRGGTKEKDVNLDVAKKIKEILDKQGYKVLLTRYTDRYVSLRDRANFANSKKGDIFVSIHCNAMPGNRYAEGFETYFLAEARTDWARTVALRENASLKYDFEEKKIKQDIELILTDLAQNEFLNESSRLAEFIQEITPKIAGIHNRGLNQAGFFVLKWVFMPSVLVEIAFISNRKEEELLKSSSFRDKVAKGIALGIIKFLDEYERKLASR